MPIDPATSKKFIEHATEVSMRASSNYLSEYLSGLPVRADEVSFRASHALDQDEKVALVNNITRLGEIYSKSTGADNKRIYECFYRFDNSETRGPTGEALQEASRRDPNFGKQLIEIASGDRSGNSGMQLMKTLELGSAHSNAAVEQLGEALWQRNQGNDRAVAAMGFASNPELLKTHLKDPDKAREAFEALVKFNETGPSSRFGVTGVNEAHEDGLRAAAAIFATHGKELVNHYLPASTDDVNAKPLAKFLSQTAFNPEAKHLTFKDKDGKDVPVGDGTLAAYKGIMDDTLSRALKTSSPDEKHHLGEQYGRESGAASAGLSLAMDRYDIKAHQRDEDRAKFVEMASKFTGLIPLDKVTDKVPVLGAVVDFGKDKLVKWGAEKYFDAMADRPDRPAMGLAETMSMDFHNKIPASQGAIRDGFDRGEGREEDLLNKGLGTGSWKHQADTSPPGSTATKYADAGEKIPVPVLSPSTSTDDKFAFLAASMKTGDGAGTDKAIAAVANAGNLGTQAAASIDHRERQAQTALETAQPPPNHGRTHSAGPALG